MIVPPTRHILTFAALASLCLCWTLVVGAQEAKRPDVKGIEATAAPGDTAGQAPTLPHLASLRGTDPVRIVAFGSSSTEGVGASSPAASYPAQLENILSHVRPGVRHVQVINRGIGGQDVDDMVARLKSDVLDKKPDLVIWQTGSNDPIRNVPLDRFEDLTRQGILAIRSTGADVMLMEPQWCPRLDSQENSPAFRTAIRKIGADMNVPVIRRYDLMQAWVQKGTITRDLMVGPDGLHMTDQGYSLLARAVADQVLSASAPKKGPSPLLVSIRH